MFTIYKVWQEDRGKINEKDVERLFNLSKDEGLRPSLMAPGLCYIDFKHFDCCRPVIWIDIVVFEKICINLRKI